MTISTAVYPVIPVQYGLTVVSDAWLPGTGPCQPPENMAKDKGTTKESCSGVLIM